MNLTEANRVWEAPIIANWTVQFLQEHYNTMGESLHEVTGSLGPPDNITVGPLSILDKRRRRQ
jgi:hypothetical protein